MNFFKIGTGNREPNLEEPVPEQKAILLGLIAKLK